MTRQVRRSSGGSVPSGGTWVVGVDGSECARSALAWTVANAPARAGAIHLLAAWQTPIYGPHSMTGPIAVPYDVDALEAAAHDDVDRLAAETSHRLRLPVEAIVVHAGATTALLDASAHSDLLVLGNRGRGGFARLLLGSTSTQCATHALVPTVVVPGGAPVGPVEQMIVGVDGSPNSLAALRWALEFAAPGTCVEVVSVWDASPLAVGADEFFFPDASETAEARFEHLVDRATADVGRRGATIERRFVHGRPRSSLAAAAENADLVVVGARGHGAVGAALLGSVSSWVLHHVPRPVVVVPHGDRRTDEPDDR